MDSLILKINDLKREKKAIILAHTYQPGDVQDCADFVGDSYNLSVKAAKEERAEIIVFCGVRFMAETAALLSASKTVILPEPAAGCPMADMITPEDLSNLKSRYPDHKVVCYVNSSVEVKALSDVCCTSSNAVKIVNSLPRDCGVIFIPDKHLGSWVMQQTGRTMILWNGFCPTHEYIQPDLLMKTMKQHPKAIVLIHPEAPPDSRKLADKVLSTGGMCDYVRVGGDSEYIIATELGIIHTLKKINPRATFYPVSNEAVCPNMKKTSLLSIYKALNGTGGETIAIPEEIGKRAVLCLNRMLELS